MTNDFLFRGPLEELDPDVAELIRLETVRQEQRLILIPSESTIPNAVREALTASFHNIYAEGYPLDETRAMTEAEILDYGARLPEYRRYADKRYYKGTEYADIVEALARRRAAEVFATERYPAEKLFVNVQPLSGAPANSAIFSGLLTVGDTFMGMDLLQGGHLTHGSPVARSGKQYHAVSYGVDPVTEKIDYERVREIALEHRPRLIIAGYTSYPYAPDWAAFRAICDEVGAYLMADVAHVAGLIIGGAYPSPVGIADVVSFTTHKTLGGPRGAIIITHRADVASKVDRGVFPGEQGGPHVNAIAAMAVSLKLAATEQFRELQQQTVSNAIRLAEKLSERGLRVAYGGTDTHLLLVDCKTITGPDGTPLSGDMAARLLDLAGIVCNRNTVPGDTAALRSSGIRLGTPWVTQRGFRESEIDMLAGLIADTLQASVPFSYTGRKRSEPRAKIDYEMLQAVKRRVAEISARVGIDTDAGAVDYPHIYHIHGDDPAALTLHIRAIGHADPAVFLNAALTSDVLALQAGEQQATAALTPEGAIMGEGVLERAADGRYLLHTTHGERVAHWLRALSDGFALFDHEDVYAKIPGPVDVQITGPARGGAAVPKGDVYVDKAYFVGQNGADYAGPQRAALPVFQWEEPAEDALKRTPLHALHKELGAKMAPFAGYEMPLWYTSVSDEHQAVRQRAGLFDVAHMGAFEASGPDAAAFLDVVTTNDVYSLEVGRSHYTYFLGVDGIPIDDLMIYRVTADRYLVVVNASNNDKNWAWLNAVLNGDVQINPAHPGRVIGMADRVTLRDLRDEAAGPERRVDIALQGPQSKAILLALGGSDDELKAVANLPWAGVTQATLGGFDLIVSRTGYTGERVAYELFVHPNRAEALSRVLIAGGAVPAGLAARDSLRIEAGLPLYGHELAGDLNLNPADAGFSSYIKLQKPFFIGKAAFITHERQRSAEVTRFRLASKGVRPPHPGDPIVDARGRVVGVVTSCSIDSDGYQLGQAYLSDEAQAADTPVAVFCGAARAKTAALAGLGIGDRVTVPEPALVLTRFPKK